MYGIQVTCVNFQHDMYNEKKNLAGIVFHVQIHATTWGPANNASKLFIGRYLNRTVTIDDRHKNIYMPSRVQIGSVKTHTLTPAKGFFMYVHVLLVILFNFACNMKIFQE